MKTAAIFATILAVAAAAPLSNPVTDDELDTGSDVMTEDQTPSYTSASIDDDTPTFTSAVTDEYMPTFSSVATHVATTKIRSIRPIVTPHHILPPHKSTHKSTHVTAHGTAHGTGRPTIYAPIETHSRTQVSRPPVSTGTPKSGNSTSGSSGTSSYKQFNGDGSTKAGWPAMSSWVKDFESLWAINEKTISGSCANLAKQYDAKAVDNTKAEMADLKAAVQSVAKTAAIDPRFALAIMVQETGGCLRIYNTTDPSGTINNPSIFQDHNGAHSCNTGGLNTQSMKYTAGKVANPCPKDQIVGMVTDGISGTKDGDGLKQVVEHGKTTYGGKDAQAYYIGARLYNSGSYDKQDLGSKGATRCYSSDIANRLIGFNGAKTGCTLK